MQSWKTLNRKTVLDRGHYLRIEDHEIQLPDGRVIPDWPWVVTPDYVNVVAITENGGYLCFVRPNTRLTVPRWPSWAATSTLAKTLLAPLSAS